MSCEFERVLRMNIVDAASIIIIGKPMTRRLIQ